MTWILTRILCHFMSKVDGSLVQLNTKFHDYSMLFIQVLFVFHAGTWHGFWKSSSHGIPMAFAKKMMGFSSDFVSFSANCRPRDMRISMLHFLQGSHEMILHNKCKHEISTYTWHRSHHLDSINWNSNKNSLTLLNCHADGSECLISRMLVGILGYLVVD